MSSFTTPADMRFIGGYKFMLLAPFEYHIGQYPSEDVVCVPAGFVTNLASIPRALWSILPPHGKWAKAAIVHDYLYTTADRPRSDCDRIFKEGMGVLGVPSTTQNLIYWAVRCFGRSAYGRNK